MISKLSPNDNTGRPMKKGTSSQSMRGSERRRQISCSFRNENLADDGRTKGRHQRRLGPFSSIKAAAKRLGGFFKSIFLLPKTSNSIAEGAETDRVGELSSISPNFSKSSETKSSLKFKSFSSYGSSSVFSGQVGTLDFSIEEIYKATNNFSPANKLGEGGYGTVYKGKLKDGSVVAIKRAKKIIYDKGVLSQFKNELQALSVIEHMNLVRLLGYVEHGDEQIILVEYIGNGTLRDHLDGKRGDVLETGERLDVAIDVAHGITYLHTYADCPIIHRDIKSTNVLITEKLRAKVSDFGFARLAEEGSDATHISTQVKGTAGYLDPEYLKTYQLTDKSDVYSFGVLLVELATGRRPIEPKMSARERFTLKWAMQKLEEEEAVIAMDPRLKRNPASTMAVENVLRLAGRCLASSRQTRPSMKMCGEVLWGIRKDYREKAFPLLPAPHFSADFPQRDAKKSRFTSFGIEEDEHQRFASA